MIDNKRRSEVRKIRRYLYFLFVQIHTHNVKWIYTYINRLNTYKNPKFIWKRVKFYLPIYILIKKWFRWHWYCILFVFFALSIVVLFSWYSSAIDGKFDFEQKKKYHIKIQNNIIAIQSWMILCSYVVPTPVRAFASNTVRNHISIRKCTIYVYKMKWQAKTKSSLAACWTTNGIFGF